MMQATMKGRVANRTRNGCGLAGLALACFLLPSVARSQIQMAGVEQPHLSPAGLHVHFSNVTVLPRDQKTAIIQFDIVWDGSWRHDVNHDAAWVFFKVRVGGEGVGRPVRLAADRVLNPTGYNQSKERKRLRFASPVHSLDAFVRGVSKPETFETDAYTQFDFLVPAGEDGYTGVIVRRADHGGPGEVASGNVTVVWDLTPHKNITKETKVAVVAYGLKMIYVAEGPFYLGSGGDETNAFYKYTDSTQDKLPYRVTSAGAIPTGKQPGRLFARGAEPEDGGEIPETFPNGFRAFYMMNGPVPQGAYAFFLDALSPEDAAARYGPELAHGRIHRLGEGPKYSYRFCHGRLKSRSQWCLSWEDSAAFAAWAGLRPMTELEHEKSLRGPRYPVPTEAAHSFWGGSYGGGRYNAHPREHKVTVGHAAGRAFKGTHGDGTLEPPADWPKKDALGVGVHGAQECASGPAGIAGPWWCTSSRIDAATGDPERHIHYGFRAARTAPEEAKWNSVRDEAESSPVLLGLPSSGNE